MSDAFFKIIDAAVQMRGVVIDNTIELERMIDDFLAFHFCDTIEKGNELKEYLLCTERVNFDAKRQIFMSLFEINHPDVYKSNPSLKKNLEEIVRCRNIFAHAELDRAVLKPYVVGDVLNFIRYKNGKTVSFGFSAEDIKHFEKNCLMVMKVLNSLNMRHFRVKYSKSDEK